MFAIILVLMYTLLHMQMSSWCYMYTLLHMQMFAIILVLMYTLLHMQKFAIILVLMYTLLPMQMFAIILVLGVGKLMKIVVIPDPSLEQIKKVPHDYDQTLIRKWMYMYLRTQSSVINCIVLYSVRPMLTLGVSHVCSH